MAEDVLRIRSHALVSNVTSEVARARRLRQGSARTGCAAREPVGHKVSVPGGLNPCDVPADVLKDYVLATKPVDFDALAGKEQRQGPVNANWPS